MRYMVRLAPWRPERVENVERLRCAIPQLEVVADTARDGYGSFFKACRSLNDSGGVLLEDDVQLCRDFCRRVEAVIDDKGQDQLVSFYERPRVALETARVGGSSFLWMQCIYMPPGLPQKCIDYYEAFRAERPAQWRGMATDRLIAYTLVQERMKYWRIRPTLVQHLPFASAIGGRAANRQTPYFIDDLEAV